MQAIILAAGMGRRLGKFTEENTKCMVPVNGVTLIDRLLNQLVSLKIKKVIIVVGYKSHNLINHIGNRYEGIINIEFINNEIYAKTNNIYSLFLAKEKLIEDDTLLFESDIIFETSILKQLIDDEYPDLALVAKYKKWMDGTMVSIDENNNILSFVPKDLFQYESSSNYYKTVNIYKFSKEFSKRQYLPFLEAYCTVMGNNEYYEAVLKVLISLDKVTLKAFPIKDEKWYEIDDVQDLKISEMLFCKSYSEKLKKYYNSYGGFWRFPNLLDFCYLVNPYFPPHKMREEMKANFDDLLEDYPSGMNVNSMLAGKYFGISKEYICVGNGAAELIKCLIETHTKGKIGVIIPTFEEYPNRKQSDMIISYIPDNINYSYSANDLIAFFENKEISTLLLVNPDNPSGNFIDIKDVLRLVSWCKKRNINIVVDESFVDFTNDFQSNSLLKDSIIENNSNLIIMKSISKSYGVPGLRLGVIASSNKTLISQIKKEISIWNINSFAEYYMQIFGKYQKDYQKACETFIEERTNFYNDLLTIPWLRVIPSQANYFLCEIIGKMTSRKLSEILLYQYNILIKDCSCKLGFNGRNYIRIAVRNREDNSRLINVLKSL